MLFIEIIHNYQIKIDESEKTTEFIGKNGKIILSLNHFNIITFSKQVNLTSTQKMNILSDSDSSDTGLFRYKTESTRTKNSFDYTDISRTYSKSTSSTSQELCASRSQDNSERNWRRNHPKCRSKSPEDGNKSRERSRIRHREIYDKDRNSYITRDEKSKSYKHSPKDRLSNKCESVSPEVKDYSTIRSTFNDKLQKKVDGKRQFEGSSVDYRLEKRMSNSDDKVKHKKSKNKKTKHKSKDRHDEKSIENDKNYHRGYIKKQLDSNTNDRCNEKQDIQITEVCGPTLPPHMLSNVGVNYTKDHSKPIPIKNYGPSLPHDFEISKEVVVSRNSSDTEDDYFIGPAPLNIESKSSAHLELEKRALELKLAKLNEVEINPSEKREEWMLNLPEIRKVTNLGLTARSFQTKERDEIGDRSSWTDTPHTKKDQYSHNTLIKTQNEKTTNISQQLRDAEQEQATKKHKRKHKREESLLEMHQKKIKKQKQKEDGKIERRPFSRDNDLKLNRVDDNQKKSMIKKAQLLGTRFSSGHSKYL